MTEEQGNEQERQGATQKAEYPTKEQSATMFNAWKQGGKEGLKQALQEARRLRHTLEADKTQTNRIERLANDGPEAEEAGTQGNAARGAVSD